MLSHIWLTTDTRPAVAAAADEIDRRLRFSPRAHARQVSDLLGALTVPPLEVLFHVSDDDRIVEVPSVR